MYNPLDEPELPTPSRTPGPEPMTSKQEQSRAPAPDTDTAAPSSPLAIGAPSDQPTAPRDDAGVQTLDLGEGNIVKLDNLGPMIINTDGTLSRIQNWQDLHPIEQERTVRLLVKKRNLVRMKKIDQEQQATGEGAVAGEDKVSALKDAAA